MNADNILNMTEKYYIGSAAAYNAVLNESVYGVMVWVDSEQCYMNNASPYSLLKVIRFIQEANEEVEGVEFATDMMLIPGKHCVYLYSNKGLTQREEDARILEAMLSEKWVKRNMV